MADPIVWKNVSINMQSAIEAASTITAITKDNPAVATETAHGRANGDLLYLSVSGMSQLDRRVVRIANADTNTYELEGVDSTEFDTFSSGTAAEVTIDTAITSATTVSASGGDFDFIDTTTIHQSMRTQMPNLPNAITYTFDHIWDPSDTGQIAMKSASDAQARRAFEIGFPSGKKVYLSGYVGFSGIPGGSAQQLVTTQGVITIEGMPTSYSS